MRVRVWATKLDGYWSIGRKFSFNVKEEIEVTDAELQALEREVAGGYYLSFEIIEPEPKAKKKG